MVTVILSSGLGCWGVEVIISLLPFSVLLEKVIEADKTFDSQKGGPETQMITSAREREREKESWFTAEETKMYVTVLSGFILLLFMILHKRHMIREEGSQARWINELRTEPTASSTIL